MYDSNWELIEGDVAHAIEVLNYSNQVNVIEAFVRFVIYHHGSDESGCKMHPDVHALREFHRTATLFLLSRPGQFRTEAVVVADQNDNVIHSPPPADEVEAKFSEFQDQLAQGWANLSALEAGAFTLWMINWVHPFKNGNGRTARAFAYACICLKLGFVLPGSSTIIELIMRDRSEYQTALKTADIAYETTGSPDVSEMTAMLERLLIEQLSSIGE